MEVILLIPLLIVGNGLIFIGTFIDAKQSPFPSTKKSALSIGVGIIVLGLIGVLNISPHLDWGAIIGLVSLSLVMGIFGRIAQYRHLKTVTYIQQKMQAPDLKPPKPVKLWNSFAKSLTSIFIVGLGVFMLYGLISTGQTVVASFTAGFMALVVIVLMMINKYWKDHFDL